MPIKSLHTPSFFSHFVILLPYVKLLYITFFSIQNLRVVAYRFYFQQDNDPKHTARVYYRQLCECPWVAQPQPGIEGNQTFLEKPENVHLPPSNLTELETWRDEEKNGVLDSPILICNACHIIPFIFNQQPYHPVAQDWLPTEAKYGWAWSVPEWETSWEN